MDFQNQHPSGRYHYSVHNSLMNDTVTPEPDQAAPPTIAPSNESSFVPKRHRKRRALLWWLLLSLVGGGGYYYYLSSHSDEGPATPQSGKGMGAGKLRLPPVAVATAVVADVALYLDGLGTVTALNTVVLHTRVEGQLTKILFREGQMVKAGDTLAEIDPRPFQVQLDQAQAQLARDEALLQNAQVDLARYRGLFKEDSIAKQQLDTQAALVHQYQATHKVDQAQIESARLQLSYCQITAPISGRIGLRQVDPGNLIHTNDQNGLVVITQLQPITVVFPLPEDRLPTLMKSLHTGITLPVEAWNRNGSTRLAEGTLLTVDNQIDPATGTIKLKAQFSNRDENLFPNQFVTVRLRLDTLRGVTTLPSAAIQRGTQGVFVYLVREDQTVTVRSIRLGPSEGNRVTVEEGILPGDRVVVDGLDKLREGARIELAVGSGAGIDRPTGETRAPGTRPEGMNHSRKGGKQHSPQ
ncbi:Multidrug resistance protein MdtA [Gammaproteobacteria bacterium]